MTTIRQPRQPPPGFPAAALDGHDLRPLLADPAAAWPHAALTTFGRGNHAVRTDRWRYIRYADGGEELYDHSRDPYEWTNLATKPEHAELKAALAKSFPATDAETAPSAKGGNKAARKGRLQAN